MTEEKIRLTKFSHGGGCGCKIAPQVLDEILKGSVSGITSDRLIVGNGSRDDAAVYRLNDTEALISTTDFFTPIVDDPFTFGKVAAANAISDVYAMGGNPIMALAILGWPIDKLPVEAARAVLDGAISVCNEAGIPLAGGHSIDTPEPVFGLAVSGRVAIEHLKRNDTAREGDLLLLTKPLGVGILSTAGKRGAITVEDLDILYRQLTQLNSVGGQLGKLDSVHAMTDVTGFGLGGHLVEMAEGSGLSAILEYSKVPVLTGVDQYLAQNIMPDATYRNWNGYGDKIDLSPDINTLDAFRILPDPQTNGGLLIAVSPDGLDAVREILKDNGYGTFTEPIGRITAKGEKVISVVK